jgi:hypothetical protein
MNRNFFFVSLLAGLFVLSNALVAEVNAQSGISSENVAKLNLMQDTLKRLSDSLVVSRDAKVRLQSSQQLIKTLVRALKVEGSYNYPFDSLKRVAVLNAPDKKFRIFNWGTMLDDGTYRYYGTIQMNNKKKLEMYPLIDYSEKIKNTDTVTSNDKWYGALYYKILQKKKRYYLFGWDGNNGDSYKKLVDVLYFNGKKPRFGAPDFVWQDKSGKRKTRKRFIIEYNKEASVSLNYDPDMKMIMYDHLIPPNDKATGIYSMYVPDGSYEAFEMKKGKWIHVDNVWTSTQQTPFPKPIDFDKEHLSKPRGSKRP